MAESESSEDESLPECGICGLRLKTQRILKRHLLKHSAETHTCEFCQKSFSDKYYLRRHMKNHSSDNICQYCGKTYTSFQILKRHERAKHDLNSKYKCSICEKLCSSKTVLDAHSLNHDQQQGKPFQCEKCTKTFLYKSTMKRHRRMCKESEDTCIKKFECFTCGKSFKTKRSLSQHKTVHFVFPMETLSKIPPKVLREVDIVCLASLNR